MGTSTFALLDFAMEVKSRAERPLGMR